ncbi:hypothetical protein P153DRAFT_361906 [Dothidotthia symphoricarpi CBS 119687]|uniref:Uncharacterized protein n=1 Tax=Dothidotthia symphoricarpi CBS 119687 TaxID=1392245 RepID=A0A6A5ZXT0_9PLEO|nr:uncharacterized protein P153DRAFT_361906 [Dothidotthia symphoricarpi CBS 119687]KAF2123577.1 hypothetical protein P153DRAFT_361906 [Dothidotthia symphoricarpi CBS 119687]
MQRQLCIAGTLSSNYKQRCSRIPKEPGVVRCKQHSDPDRFPPHISAQTHGNGASNMNKSRHAFDRESTLDRSPRSILRDLSVDEQKRAVRFAGEDIEMAERERHPDWYDTVSTQVDMPDHSTHGLNSPCRDHLGLHAQPTAVYESYNQTPAEYGNHSPPGREQDLLRTGSNNEYPTYRSRRASSSSSHMHTKPEVVHGGRGYPVHNSHGHSMPEFGESRSPSRSALSVVLPQQPPTSAPVLEQIQKDSNTFKLTVQKLCQTIALLEGKIQQHTSQIDNQTSTIARQTQQLDDQHTQLGKQANLIHKMENRDNKTITWLEESVGELTARVRDQQKQIDLQTGLLTRVVDSSRIRSSTPARTYSEGFLDGFEPPTTVSSRSRTFVPTGHVMSPQLHTKAFSPPAKPNMHGKHSVYPHPTLGPEHRGASLKDAFAPRPGHMGQGRYTDTNPWAHSLAWEHE